MNEYIANKVEEFKNKIQQEQININEATARLENFKIDLEVYSKSLNIDNSFQKSFEEAFANRTTDPVSLKEIFEAQLNGDPKTANQVLADTGDPNKTPRHLPIFVVGGQSNKVLSEEEFKAQQKETLKAIEKSIEKETEDALKSLTNKLNKSKTKNPKRRTTQPKVKVAAKKTKR